MPIVRDEYHGDVTQIRQVLKRAFNRPDEADLVDALRESDSIALSMVAETGRRLVGHILFTPATVEDSTLLMVALSPMAVDPAYQHRGLGTLLVKTGLEHCRMLGFDAVIVLGHPDYYSRFGFVPASQFGLIPSWPDIPDEAFMAMELTPGALNAVSGMVHYETNFYHCL